MCARTCLLLLNSSMYSFFNLVPVSAASVSHFKEHFPTLMSLPVTTGIVVLLELQTHNTSTIVINNRVKVCWRGWMPYHITIQSIECHSCNARCRFLYGGNVKRYFIKIKFPTEMNQLQLNPRCKRNCMLLVWIDVRRTHLLKDLVCPSLLPIENYPSFFIASTSMCVRLCVPPHSGGKYLELDCKWNE